MNLYEMAEEYSRLLFEIEAMQGGEVTEEQEERLASLEALSSRKIDAYIAVRAEMLLMAEGAEAESKRLAELAKRRRSAITRLEGRVLSYLEQTGQRSVEGQLGKVWLQRASSGSLIIEDEEAFIREYRGTNFVNLVPESYRVNKNEVAAAIKGSAATFNGVTVAEPKESLRWK